jgi:DNA-binding response OmpR family regulator
LKVAKDKVLVVDDDPMMRLTLSEALRSWGYVPIETASVAAATSSFEAELPSAVLLDIDLPDGSSSSRS